MVKNLPVIQETQVRSLGGEDPLEKEMATNSSILAWKIPWTEEPGYSPWGHETVAQDLVTQPPPPLPPPPKELDNQEINPNFSKHLK